MVRVLLILVGITCLNCVAMAGPNAGGTLIITSTDIEYVGDDTDSYCDLGLNGDCESGNSNQESSPIPSVWTIHAAFFDGTSPRLSGVTFGLDNYDDSRITITDFGSCGDFELPDGLWPAPGSGTAIVWDSPQTTRTTQVYWIAGYAYYGGDISIGLDVHPTHGGEFADDSLPAELDPIVAFGSLGFNNNPGLLPCPTEGGPKGACCVPGELDCVLLNGTDCETADGDYQGDYTNCFPDPCPKPGACCFDTGICAVLEAVDCQTAGGVFGGENTTCDPNPCPQPGACCSVDGTCTTVLEVSCSDDFQGEGTVCEPNPCPQPGACCDADGTCIVTAEFACAGEYLGNGTVCEPNPCPQPGACCAFVGTCTVTAEFACADEYLGNGTVCEPNPCIQAGACCAEDGTCVVTREVDCTDDYQGDNTVCKPNTCPNAPPLGACCNVRNGTCRLVPAESVCDQFLEYYRGDGTFCDPNRCPWLDGSVVPPAHVTEITKLDPAAPAAVEGACCASDGSCAMTSEEMCDEDYLGDETGCDPNPCDLTPILERSWGWIKFTYR